MVELTEQNDVAGFVHQTGGDSDAQVLVYDAQTTDFDDCPYATPALQTAEWTLFRLPGFGLPDEDDPDATDRCPSCVVCEVTECILSGFDDLPVAPYNRQWSNGVLSLSFAFSDRDELEATVRSLRGMGFRVDLKSLSEVDSRVDLGANLLVDMGTLTPRQREVIQLAVRRGYFSSGGAGAAELAAELDISASTFSEHVRTGLGKLLAQVVDS